MLDAALFCGEQNACSVSVSVVFNSVCGLSLDKERQGSRYALLENANEQIFAVILSEVFHDPTHTVECIPKSVARQVFDPVRTGALKHLLCRMLSS